MIERAESYHNPELAELRSLTEVNHLLDHMDEKGDVPGGVFDDVAQNRETGTAEISMPYAVTETEHEVVYQNEGERRRRVILWLGKTAVEVAESGYKFHFSRQAYRRVDVEVAEGEFVEEKLRPGVAEVLMSPRMTRHDAPEEIAKAEHLHADDSLRVSTAITNAQGEVVSRRLRSLLVRGVPFEAWTTMLQDPGNIFGKAFKLRDDKSAVSVMELFSQMELPESALPEGPVTLVAAVLPYIKDEEARRGVEYQLQRFRGDQTFYAREAKQAGREWALFDLELARSLRDGWATEAVEAFIMQNQDAWNDESLEILARHELGNGEHEMTSDLAALLSRAKQKLIGDQLSVVTDNDAAIEHVSAATRAEIKKNHAMLAYAREQNIDPRELYALEQRQYQLLHQQPIESGAGCAGVTDGMFGGRPIQLSDGAAGVGESANPFKSNVAGATDMDKLGSRAFSCPKGHYNYRLRANDPVPKCQVCSRDVSCKAPEPKPTPSPSYKMTIGSKQQSERNHNDKMTVGSDQQGERRQDRTQVASSVGKQALVAV